MRDLSDSRVLVLGLGRSGRSAARFLARRGASVLAADERPAHELADLGELAGRVELALGRPFPDPAAFDLVVPSPGVPRERWADRARLALGDVELAWRALAVPVVAVTGTNGKTTTARLLVALLRAAGLRAEAAGNIGLPALELVGRPLDIAVLEVSSFQLEASEAFRPRVAVLLNVAPDHLDRHHSFEAYVETKARILVNLEPGDTAILNGDDPVLVNLARRTRARRWLFRTRGPVEQGACWDSGGIVLRDGPETLRLPWEGWDAETAPAVENVLAALAAVRALGADAAKGHAALLDFRGLPHRREIVTRRGGVTWVNDSKATNPAATLHALERGGPHVIWLAGGRDKGLDFARLAERAATQVREAVLFGEAGLRLAEALAGRVPVRTVADLDAAVRAAAGIARQGDVVLLSPACSSFDQFQSFEERGECFRAAVARLAVSEGSGP